jgi:hypothetical protein
MDGLSNMFSSNPLSSLNDTEVSEASYFDQMGVSFEDIMNQMQMNQMMKMAKDEAMSKGPMTAQQKDQLYHILGTYNPESFTLENKNSMAAQLQEIGISPSPELMKILEDAGYGKAPVQMPVSAESPYTPEMLSGMNPAYNMSQPQGQPQMPGLIGAGENGEFQPGQFRLMQEQMINSLTQTLGQAGSMSSDNGLSLSMF